MPLKEIAFSFLPASHRRRAHRYMNRAATFAAKVLHYGLRCACPCCGGSFRAFLSQPGRRPRRNARCPACGSLERHRFLCLFLREKTGFFRDILAVFDIAPMPRIQSRFESQKNLFYVSADMASDTVSLKMDLTDIPLADGVFDGLICCHVLEHIPNDRKAMRELHRVLKPGGWAVFQSHMDSSLKTTFEDPGIADPKERERLFGQHDHVRVYGQDHQDRLQGAGFSVSVIHPGQLYSRKSMIKYGLDKNEPLFFCSKAY